MKKIIEHLTHFSREILIISLSLLLLSNVLSGYQTNVKLKTQTLEYSKMKSEVDSLRAVNDSIFSENFNLEIELHRHELTRDEVFIKHPDVRAEYEYYLGHYTE